MGSTSVAALLAAIASGDHETVFAAITSEPSLVTAHLGRDEECFIEACRAQVYEGDTALHAAAFAYDAVLAAELLHRGADVRARNRRGAEPLHAATLGAPGSAHWDPGRQRAVIRTLLDAGAAPDARALGGVTPLHRAVRNRCTGAAAELLLAGADASARNDSGSTPTDLARHTTGRGGSGSVAAKAEQRLILELLRCATLQD